MILFFDFDIWDLFVLTDAPFFHCMDWHFIVGLLKPISLVGDNFQKNFIIFTFLQNFRIKVLHCQLLTLSALVLEHFSCTNLVSKFITVPFSIPSTAAIFLMPKMLSVLVNFLVFFHIFLSFSWLPDGQIVLRCSHFRSPLKNLLCN
jgi:hypothetical protein